MKFIIWIIFIHSFLICNAFSQELSFDEWYTSLSDNEKISMLFVTGLKSSSLSNSEKKLFKKWPMGGFIFFKRNFSNNSNFLTLKQQLETLSPQTLFSFTDQEGGNVARIGSVYDSPTPMSVGELNSEKISFYLGQAYGSLLSHLNINSNLAPVVDIRSKDKLNFISTRSFGTDPVIVSRIALSLSKGMLKEGVIPTLKHFPGLGGTLKDSHKKTPTKSARLDEIIRSDWLPYIHHSRENLPFFIMSSHTKLVLNEIDYGIVTYSKKSLDLIRSLTSQNQVIVTDDLEMQGAKVDKPFPKAAYESFMAGHDLILIGWPGSKLISTLNYFRSKLSDKNFNHRLKESLNRLYSLKYKADKLAKNRTVLTKTNALKLTRGLNAKISEYLLKKDFKELNLARTPATQKDIFYYSSDPLFLRSLRSRKYASLLKSSTATVQKNCLKYHCILHLTGSKTAKKINGILKNQVASNYTVLNSADPFLLTTEFQKSVPQINVFTRSYALGKDIESLIQSTLTKSKNTVKPKTYVLNH